MSQAELEEDKARQGYPWPVVEAPRQLITDLRVTVRSTKVAIGRDGVITFRTGYGVGPREGWDQLFQRLIKGSGDGSGY